MVATHRLSLQRPRQLHLDGNEYGKYGATTFDVQILVIDKTGKTPGENWKEQLKHIVGNGSDARGCLGSIKHIVDRPEPDKDPGRPKNQAQSICPLRASEVERRQTASGRNR